MNKFEVGKLTPIPSEKVKVPSIAECPVHLECVLRHIRSLGSHDLFIGEIVALRADEAVLRSDQSSIDMRELLPFTYCPGGPEALEYWGLRERIGTLGFTNGKM